MTGYVISTVRTTPYGQVAFEIVTDTLQRLTVTMPPKRTSAVEIDETITHALTALARKPPTNFT